MTAPDAAGLRELLAKAGMSLPLEADDVAVFDADGELVADTVGKRASEAHNARLFAAAVNALPGLLDVVDAAREYMREKTSPAPDLTMVILRRNQLFAALEKTDGR